MSKTTVCLSCMGCGVIEFDGATVRCEACSGTGDEALAFTGVSDDPREKVTGDQVQVLQGDGKLTWVPLLSGDDKQLRQYAAIELRVPNSGVDWLDDMIREARLMDFAGQALVGYVTDTKHPDNSNPTVIAEWCYRNANAMLAEKHRREENPNA